MGGRKAPLNFLQVFQARPVYAKLASLANVGLN